MLLTRHETEKGIRWARDGFLLPPAMDLSTLLAMPHEAMLENLSNMPGEKGKNSSRLAPLDALHEVWAAGVTYQRSRQARQAESATADVYERVYEAARPELFFKAIGWRVVGDGIPVRIRGDSRWNVPEPELVLVVNSSCQIVGYTAGNDMSSRDIEGENPLYLPQAKVYRGACAIGPGIQIAESDVLDNVSIGMMIRRQGSKVFEDETTTARMKRPLTELVDYLTRELTFPSGVFLMTGTGIVPPNEFSLRPGDSVEIRVGDLTILNPVEA